MRTGSSGRVDGAMWFAAAVLLVVGGVVPVVVAHHFGALGIPRNDDWSYLRSAFTFGETGHLDGNDWVTVSLVGQLVLALPVVWLAGSRVAPLQLEVVALGVIGLIAVHDLARAVVGSRRALFVALVVAVGPLWAPLTVSFMTDVPAFALVMVALTLGARSIRADGLHRGWFVTAIAVAVLAATIRDSAVVIVATIAIVAWWCVTREQRSSRRFVAIVVAAAAVAFLGFWWWKNSLPGFGPDAQLHLKVEYVDASLHRIQGLIAPLGICTAPAVVLAGPVRLVRRSWARARVMSLLVAIGVGVLLAQYSASTGDLFGPGNYLDRRGTLGDRLIPGVRPVLLGVLPRTVVGLLGGAVAVVLAVAAVGPCADGLARLRRRRWDPPASPALAVIVVAAVAVAAFMFLSYALGNAMWDRYLLPLVPLVSILALAAGDAARAREPAPGRDPAPALRRGAAVVVLVGLAVLGGIYGANSASYDGTRRAVAEAAARGLADPSEVDGGFEWNSALAGREAYFTHRPKRACVVVRGESSKPRAGEHDVVDAAEVWRLGGSGGWIVARSVRTCAAG